MTIAEQAPIVFLGSNPSNASPFLDPFTHCRSAHVLGSWIEKLGLKPETIKLANVANYKTANNKPLTGSQISAEVPRLMKELNGAVVFALGSAAYRAAKKCDRYPAKLRAIIQLPHPSGRNRLLNDKDYVAQQLARARAELEKVLSLTP